MISDKKVNRVSSVIDMLPAKGCCHEDTVKTCTGTLTCTCTGEEGETKKIVMAGLVDKLVPTYRRQSITYVLLGFKDFERRSESCVFTRKPESTCSKWYCA
jgi:hypothetical protein